MERLTDCPAYPAEKCNKKQVKGQPRRTGKGFRVCIRDDKTGQSLLVESDTWPITARRLDDETIIRPEGEKVSDALLIAEHEGGSLVCFIELKSKLVKTRDDKLDPWEHSLAKFDDSLAHFCPGDVGQQLQQTHGDEHHTQWSVEEDTLEVMPAEGHKVAAVVVVNRQGQRPPLATQLRWAGKTIPVIPLQISHDRGIAVISLEDFLRKVMIG